MDSCGVAQAWVGAFEGLFYRDCGQANRDLLTSLEDYGDRLLPWAVINPASPGWEQDLEEARAAGVLGVRLYPNYHDYRLLDASCLDLCAALAENRLPAAIYHKFVDERLHHWHARVPATQMTVGPLLARFPALSIDHRLDLADRHTGVPPI